MSARAKIRSALRARLLTDDLLPATRQWEGERLDPAPSTTFVRESLLVGASEAEFEGGMVETTGVYQLDVVGPVRPTDGTSGTALLDPIAESLAAQFPIWSRLVADGFAVEIVRVATGPLVPFDAGRQFVPVSISWRAYHTNPAPVLQ